MNLAVLWIKYSWIVEVLHWIILQDKMFMVLQIHKKFYQPFKAIFGWLLWVITGQMGFLVINLIKAQNIFQIKCMHTYVGIGTGGGGERGAVNPTKKFYKKRNS